MIELKSKVFRNSKLTPLEKGKIFYSNFLEINKSMQTYKSHGEIHKFAFSLITLSNISEEMKYLLEICEDKTHKKELEDFHKEMNVIIDEYKNRISLI